MFDDNDDDDGQQSEFDDGPEVPRQVAVHYEALILLARWFVNELAVERGWTTEDIATNVSLAGLFAYIQQQRESRSDEIEDVIADIAKRNKVNIDDLRSVYNVVMTDPFAFTSAIMLWWPVVVRRDPPLTHTPVWMSVRIGVLFADDVMTSVETIWSRRPTKAHPITPGKLHSFMNLQYMSTSNTIAAMGFDAVHDNGIASPGAVAALGLADPG